MLFRRRGYNRVGVDEVAAAAGITKRTLYYHFKSKDDLFASMLEAQHELTLEAFRIISEKLSGGPERIAEGIFRQLEIWSAKPGWAASGFTRLVIELADLPGHPARVIAKRHKAIMEANLAELLSEGRGPLFTCTRPRNMAVGGGRDGVDPHPRRSKLREKCVSRRQTTPPKTVGGKPVARCRFVGWGACRRRRNGQLPFCGAANDAIGLSRTSGDVRFCAALG
jgi:AcrR family transcriptional regulator